MTVKDIVKELQGLVNTGHGDEQLYAGWPEPLEVSVECHHQYDGSVKVWFKMGYVTALAAEAGRQLPQPQEQVKATEVPCTCPVGNMNHASWCGWEEQLQPLDKGKGDLRRAMDLLEQGFD